MDVLQTPQKLSNGVYWLGTRRNVRLEPNSYLLIFEGNGKKFAVLVDPGGPNVSKTILKRLTLILKDLRTLRLIFLSQQDSDAGFNIAYLLKQQPRLAIVCTDDVWRLAYSLGVSSTKFLSVEKLHDGCAHLPTGHTLRLIPVPFCPSRGACMLYDVRSRILFSGGVFGGITFTLSLFATPQHWEGIRIWHQMYIPTQQILRRTIDLVRALDPPPVMIAPQHGGLLKEELIAFVLDKLSGLPVGIDIPHTTEIDKVMYIEAINDVLATISTHVGSDIIGNLLHRLDEDRSFPHLFTFRQGRLTDIKDDMLGDVMGAFKMFLYALIEDQPSSIQEIVREAVLQSNWDLPIFMQTFVSRK